MKTETRERTGSKIGKKAAARKRQGTVSKVAGRPRCCSACLA